MTHSNTSNHSPFKLQQKKPKLSSYQQKIDHITLKNIILPDLKAQDPKTKNTRPFIRYPKLCFKNQNTSRCLPQLYSPTNSNKNKRRVSEGKERMQKLRVENIQRNLKKNVQLLDDMIDILRNTNQQQLKTFRVKTSLESFNEFENIDSSAFKNFQSPLLDSKFPQLYKQRNSHRRIFSEAKRRNQKIGTIRHQRISSVSKDKYQNDSQLITFYNNFKNNNQKLTKISFSPLIQ